MSIRLKFSRSIVGWIAMALCVPLSLVPLVQVAGAVSPTPSGDEKLVTVYDQGQEQSFVTKATTVRQALQDDGIKISEQDAIEPGLDAKLEASSYNINIYRARPVTVIDGAVSIKIVTAEQSPSKIVSKAGLTLYPEDETSFKQIDSSDVLSSSGAGVNLVIKRATAFNLTLYGKKLLARTQTKTIKDMLHEKGIVLGTQDGISTGLNAPITTDMNVAVWRNGVQTVTEEQPIDFTTDKIQDKDKEIGYRAIRTVGIPGKKQVTYQINMQNNVEVSRQVIQSVTTLEPTKQVEVVGAKVLGVSDSFSGALTRLRACEAGGNYARNSGNGYYGAYQYNLSTWANYSGYARPDLAPPAVQDQKAYETYVRRGWQPWPACSANLGLQDVYR
jgi:uncharacterized protein YabE (DUF348 family)